MFFSLSSYDKHDSIIEYSLISNIWNADLNLYKKLKKKTHDKWFCLFYIMQQWVLQHFICDMVLPALLLPPGHPKPIHYWSWPPQSTNRKMELNTLDLGRQMGAIQWGSGTCIVDPGLVPVLTMLEGFGSVYGLWVKITVARSNRKCSCKAEGVEAWVVSGKTHA